MKFKVGDHIENKDIKPTYVWGGEVIDIINDVYIIRSYFTDNRYTHPNDEIPKHIIDSTCILERRFAKKQQFKDEMAEIIAEGEK